ncbi:hypothetical protein B484DRAFT_448190 [Ochromonadaceae sp. CCMP2298]|nr:hypothetical protein B484DRAFT_448190 [Ochromonadaceae sp. CCMP2298]|mmetsp:Transcript_21392/g.47504  ORF Transcript_21392/g.47504 Transcript_21392/m.47504 type:complete len:209 (-) Transcript_21392:33-659(-)
MASERIEKYLEDAKKHVAGQSTSKILAEMKKINTWLQKHQNESVPEGAKTKLISTVEVYFKYCTRPGAEAGLLEAASDVVGSYLQLPEGKLVSANYKKKALAWHQDIAALESGKAASSSAFDSIISHWFLDTLNDDGTLNLLNKDNSEIWLENYSPLNLADYLENMRSLCSENDSVVVELDERFNIIRAVRVEDGGTEAGENGAQNCS